MHRFAGVAALTILASAIATAQHVRPYAEMDQREVKALSEAQIADLRAGRGMGLALPAELNGYPGPLHVIELADQLELSGEQRARTQQLFEAMKSETVGIGERLIREETILDRQFASKTITPQSLEAFTKAIGSIQAELRHAHLKYHLSTTDILTANQIKRYGELRGYNHGSKPFGHGHR
jgi:hypothetical protein